MKWTVPLDTVVRCISFSTCGKLLASGGRDGKLIIWDANTGEPLLGPMQSHSQSIHSVAFSPDGTRVISGSRDKSIRVWDSYMGHAILKPLLKHTQCITSVAHSSMHILSASKDGSVCFWDAYTGGLLAQYRVGSGAAVRSVAFSSDGTWALSGSDSLHVWVLGNTTWEASNYPATLFSGSCSTVKSVAISSYGNRVLCASDTGVRVFAVHNGESLSPVLDRNDSITSAAISPNGQLVISGSREGVLRLRDVENKGEILCGCKLSIGGGGGRNYLNRDIYCAMFSPDGNTVACGDTVMGVRVYSLY